MGILFDILYFFSSCETYARDMLNFFPPIPVGYQKYPCGFSHGANAQSPLWESCPDGDNERRMKYFIRYVYDGDDDGFVAEEDCGRF